MDAELIIRKKDLIVTGITLFVIVTVLTYHYFDRRSIHRQLQAFAEARITDLLGEETDRSQYDIISIVEQHKTFYVLGETYGSVHAFVRKKGDTEMRTFKGIEYHVKRDADKWIELDSAGCGALEHHVDGFNEFEKRGLQVAQAAYDRALGWGNLSDHDDSAPDDHADHNHTPKRYESADEADAMREARRAQFKRNAQKFKAEGLSAFKPTNTPQEGK